MTLSKIFRLIFTRMFFISAFTFGGGYVVVSMIQQYFVKENKLLKNQEMLDMAAIAQSSLELSQ